MKKLKFLLVVMLAFLMIPSVVLAEESSENKEVTVYIFRGEGCPHCEEAEEWFSSIEDQYGSKFKIKDYETWYDTDNADLMERVAKARGEEASGVPYIIIGNQSWNGFDDSYKDEMLSKIDSEYEQDPSTRYDIMELVGEGDANATEKKENYTDDFLILVLVLVVVGGCGFGIYYARKKTV